MENNNLYACIISLLVPGKLISESVVVMLQICHDGFSHFLLHVDVAVWGSFDFMRLLKFLD